MKPVMIVIGLAMMVGGVVQMGCGSVASGFMSFVYGSDMFASSAFGISPISEVFELPLRSLVFSGKNTAFMDQESFSFFQFTSDHAINLVLTQLTFMLIGGIVTGYKTLKNYQSIRENGAGGEYPVFAFQKSYGLTTKWFGETKTLTNVVKHFDDITWSDIAVQWLLNQISHLAGGSLMLLTFQLVGSTTGATILPDLILQGLILAQVAISTYITVMHKIDGVKPSTIELVNRFRLEREHGFLFGGTRWAYNALNSQKTTSSIKTLAVLELVLLSAKLATVVARTLVRW